MIILNTILTAYDPEVSHPAVMYKVTADVQTERRTTYQWRFSSSTDRALQHALDGVPESIIV
jgi:hypothetical protein